MPSQRKNTVLGTLYRALVVLQVCLSPFPSPSPITPTNNNHTLLCNILRFTFCSAAKTCECQMQQKILQLNKTHSLLTSDQVSKLKLKLIFKKIGSDSATKRALNIKLENYSTIIIYTKHFHQQNK